MRRLALALVALAALAPCAAVAADNPLAAAYAKTAKAGSLRLTTSGTANAGSVAVPFSGSGEVDNATGRTRLDLTIVGTGHVELVVDGKADKVFMRFPLLNRTLRVTKPWISIDLRTASRTLGLQAGLGDLVKGSNVVQQLQVVQAAAGPVRRIGAEQVRGAPTTHYRTRVRYSALARVLPADAAAAARAQGSRTTPLDVWIGGDGYVHRVRYSATLTQAGRRVSSTSSYELYDFGAKLDIAVPPASQVQDLTSLLGNPEGGG